MKFVNSVEAFTIIINIIMKKKVQIHRIPTEDVTDIVLNTYCFTEAHGNPLKYVPDFKQDSLIERGFKYQHLYFTNNEKIEEGDWMYWVSQNKIIRCTDNSMS